MFSVIVVLNSIENLSLAFHPIVFKFLVKDFFL